MKKFVGLIIWKYEPTTGVIMNANHKHFAQLKLHKYVEECYGGYNNETMEDYFVVDESNMVLL